VIHNKYSVPGFKIMSNCVYLLTSGDGSYGDEWVLHSIHLTRKTAERAKQIYETERFRGDGSSYHYKGTIEEWPTEETSHWKTIDSAPLNGTIVDLIELDGNSETS
jgi:hypothetical protein